MHNKIILLKNSKKSKIFNSFPPISQTTLSAFIWILDPFYLCFLENFLQHLWGITIDGFFFLRIFISLPLKKKNKVTSSPGWAGASCNWDWVWTLDSPASTSLHSLFCFVVVVLFWDMVLCIPCWTPNLLNSWGWPLTSGLPASTFRVLELQAYAPLIEPRALCMPG